MVSTPRIFKSEHQQNIVKLIDSITGRHSRFEIWSDWLVMSAIMLSNINDSRHRETREKRYLTIAEKYNGRELETLSQMFAELVNGLEENPDQDFLGELYMGMEMGNANAGQFFTPYHLSSLTAKMPDNEKLLTTVETEGWICVSDPACGAGALLVAFANRCRQPEIDINYQSSVLFVAQDADFLVGCMCYLQLSLLGCPGYVVIADSLHYPADSYDGRGLIPIEENRDIWYTPYYFRDDWQLRRSVLRRRL